MQLGKTLNNKIIYTNDNSVEEYFACMCHSDEHLIRFAYFVEKDGTIEDEGLYVSVHLSGGNLWHRIKRAVAYVFGYRCRYGDWDEVLFKRQDAERLQSLLNTYINSEITGYEPKTISVKMKSDEPKPVSDASTDGC